MSTPSAGNQCLREGCAAESDWLPRCSMLILIQLVKRRANGETTFAALLPSPGNDAGAGTSSLRPRPRACIYSGRNAATSWTERRLQPNTSKLQSLQARGCTGKLSHVLLPVQKHLPRQVKCALELGLLPSLSRGATSPQLQGTAAQVLAGANITN